MVAQGEEGTEGSAESWLGLGGLGVPGLPPLSVVAKYSCLLCWTPREKSSVEEEIKEKEEAVSQRSGEVQVRSRCLCLSVRLSLSPVQRTLRDGINATVMYIFPFKSMFVLLLQDPFLKLKIQDPRVVGADAGVNFCFSVKHTGEEINNTFGWLAQMLLLRGGEAGFCFWLIHGSKGRLRIQSDCWSVRLISRESHADVAEFLS